MPRTTHATWRRGREPVRHRPPGRDDTRPMDRVGNRSQGSDFTGLMAMHRNICMGIQLLTAPGRPICSSTFTAAPECLSTTAGASQAAR